MAEDLPSISALDFSPDGKTLAVVGQKNRAVFMDASKLGKKISSIEGKLYSTKLPNPLVDLSSSHLQATTACFHT